MIGYDRWTYGDDDVWDSVREVNKALGITSMVVGGVEMMAPGAVPPADTSGPVFMRAEIVTPREMERKRRDPLWKRVANRLAPTPTPTTPEEGARDE